MAWRLRKNMQTEENLIREFIEKQQVATICCLDNDDAPYCFNCFYVFEQVDYMLVFRSSPNSHHAKLLVTSGKVAGTILPLKLNLLFIKGIQFSGNAFALTGDQQNKLLQLYHKRYPFAAAIKGSIYAVRLEDIKLSDNARSPKKKVRWRRHESEAA